MLPNETCHHFVLAEHLSLIINLTGRLRPFPCCTTTSASKIICHTASQPFIYTPCSSMPEPNAMQCRAMPCHASFAVTSTPDNEKSQPHENKVLPVVTIPRSATIFISHVVAICCFVHRLAKKLLDILYPLKLLLFIIHHSQRRRSAHNQSN